MIYLEHKQKQRFYMLMVEQDIFNTWCLKRVFGSLLNRRGRTIMQIFESEKQAWVELTEIEHKKRQCGYVYVDFDIETHLRLRPQNLFEITTGRQSLVQTSLKSKVAIEKVINHNQLELLLE